MLKNCNAQTVLEVGIGSGKNVELMGEASITGIDISPDMLSFVRERFPRVRLILADAHRLPFKSDTFDICLFCYCLRSLDRPVEATREALRIARQVLIIDYDRPTFIPRIIWDRIIERFGNLVFGSHQLDFNAVEQLSSRASVKTLYKGLYRVVRLER